MHYFLILYPEKETNKEEISKESISKASIDEKEEIVQETISSADSIFIKSIIRQLMEIEKFAVQEDFYLLSSLLEYKGESSTHEKVIAILKKKDEYIRDHIIEVFDTKNRRAIEFY